MGSRGGVGLGAGRSCWPNRNFIGDRGSILGERSEAGEQAREVKISGYSLLVSVPFISICSTKNKETTYRGYLLPDYHQLPHAAGTEIHLLPTLRMGS